MGTSDLQRWKNHNLVKCLLGFLHTHNRIPRDLKQPWQTGHPSAVYEFTGGVHACPLRGNETRP